MNPYLEVHLQTTGLNPRMHSHRALALSERNMPFLDLKNVKSRAKRIKIIYDVLKWLNVEESPRYKPGQNLTYCNIYVYDFAFCLGAYIPRVWWDKNSSDRILSGEEVRAVYGQTIFEQNCNAIYEWFLNFGPFFSWKQIEHISEYQKLINANGTLGVIIAKRCNIHESGHITAVLPETELINQHAGIKYPILQSQAGAENKELFYDNWWDNDKFSGHTLWLLEIHTKR